MRCKKAQKLPTLTHRSQHDLPIGLECFGGVLQAPATLTQRSQHDLPIGLECFGGVLQSPSILAHRGQHDLPIGFAKSCSKAIVGTTKRSIDAIPSAWL